MRVSQAGAVLSVHMLQQNAIHLSSAALLSNLGNVLSVILLLKIFCLYVKLSLITKKLFQWQKSCTNIALIFPQQHQINTYYFSKT